jgi:methylenetetrahydrofolate--tRNA-(uracil-5-)-methyltransferase
LALSAPPEDTALGAILAHVTGGHIDGGARSFQPMNINYGLLPPLAAPKRDAQGARLSNTDRGRAKKALVSRRALAALEGWVRHGALSG